MAKTPRLLCTTSCHCHGGGKGLSIPRNTGLRKCGGGSHPVLSIGGCFSMRIISFLIYFVINIVAVTVCFLIAVSKIAVISTCDLCPFVPPIGEEK